MKSVSKLGTIGLISLAILLTNCTSQSKPINTCLPPVLAVGYPYRIERSDPIGLTQREIPKIWEPQLTEEQLQVIPAPNFSGSIVSTNDFIWYSYGQYVISYQINDHKVRVYDLLANSLISEHGSISSMFLDSKGEIWLAISGSEGTPIVHYNSMLDKFERVDFLDETGNSISLPKQALGSPNPNIHEISPGELLLFFDQNLWHLDVASKKATQVFEKPHDLVVRAVAVGREKTIWILAQYSLEKIKQTGISESLVYLFSQNKLDEVAVIPNSSGEQVYPLAIDSKNRLWISNLGWVELLEKPVFTGGHQQKAMYYKMIESSLFIKEDSVMTYGYFAPVGLTTSSNGNIWFSSEPGIIRLDPDNGDWCLMARGVYASMTESPDGSIWFADKQLYRYSP